MKDRFNDSFSITERLFSANRNKLDLNRTFDDNQSNVFNVWRKKYYKMPNTNVNKDINNYTLDINEEEDVNCTYKELIDQ